MAGSVLSGFSDEVAGAPTDAQPIMLAADRPIPLVKVIKLIDLLHSKRLKNFAINIDHVGG